MRVALDARMIDHTGIGVSIDGWLEGLAELDAAERPAMALLGDPDRLRARAEALGAEVIPFRAPIYSLREQALYPVDRMACDLLHVPHYLFPLRWRGRLLVTVHDVFHVRFGGPLKASYMRFFLRRMVRRRIPVLTVSQFSRNELIEIGGLDPARITVIEHGLSSSARPLGDPALAEGFRRERGLPDRYLLSVGGDLPHKNLRRLLNALAFAYRERGLTAPFVMAGIAEADRGRMLERAGALHCADRIHIIGRFRHSEAPLLYAGAIGLVFPSLYEGFGFPPLEAMAMGAPAAVSDRPPMTELCGGAALLFNPEDEASIAEAVARLANDEGLRGDLAGKGFRNAARFCWRDAAVRLVEAYRRAIHEDS